MPKTEARLFRTKFRTFAFPSLQSSNLSLQKYQASRIRARLDERQAFRDRHDLVDISVQDQGGNIVFSWIIAHFGFGERLAVTALFGVQDYFQRVERWSP